MNKYEDKEMLHLKDGDVEYLQFKTLNKYNVLHCITLRHGGVSENERSSLNFRNKGLDKVENVRKNLAIIREKLNFSNVYKANQDHTDTVIHINNENKDQYLAYYNGTEEKADAYIVDEKKIATLITTADCNPIIIYDPVRHVVANVHAGWKGVINRVYINAIKKMEKDFGSKAEDLIVCIGPSIRKCCFSSEEESFKEKFTSVFDYSNKYLEYEENSKRFHIDLIVILKEEFRKAGVQDKNVHIADICTRCNTEDFFSYRECCQKGFKDYGTMATIVELL